MDKDKYLVVNRVSGLEENYEPAQLSSIDSPGLAAFPAHSPGLSCEILFSLISDFLLLYHPAYASLHPLS